MYSRTLSALLALAVLLFGCTPGAGVPPSGDGGPDPTASTGPDFVVDLEAAAQPGELLPVVPLAQVPGHHLRANVPIPAPGDAGTCLCSNGVGETPSWCPCYPSTPVGLPDGGTGAMWYESDAGTVVALIACPNGDVIEWAKGIPTCVAISDAGLVLPDAGVGGIWYQGDEGVPDPVGLNCATGQTLLWLGGVPTCAAYSDGGSGFTAGADLAGNGTSTATSQYVSSLSYDDADAGGKIAVKGTSTYLSWTASGGPLITQDTTSAATGTAFTIVPQQSTNANPTGGPLIINLQAPGGSGGEAFVQVARGGTTETWIGNQPLGGAGAPGVWLGTATPTSTNYRLLGLAATYINSPTGSVVLQSGGGTVITANTTSVLFGSTADMGNFALKNVKTVTYDQEVADSCATTVTINWTAGQKHALTVTGNCTVSFTNPLGPCNTIVRIIQGGSGGFTVTWPSSTTQKWPGGTAPVITSAAGSVDIVSEYWSGSAYYGTFAQAFQ